MARFAIVCVLVAAGCGDPSASSSGGALLGNGETCDDDLQCASQSCNREARKCRATSWEPCTPEVGCRQVPAVLGTYVCIDGRCVYVTPGGAGDSCDAHTPCARGSRCIASPVLPVGVCSSGETGAPCARPADCRSGRCNSMPGAPIGSCS
jgi:hypothetical protein